MQFSQLYENAVSKLSQAGIDSAPVDAFLLFEFCFGLTRSQLFLHGAIEVPAQELVQFNSVLDRRLSREPLHYITGMREFWSLDFVVSPAVLIPRPETEFVIDTVLATMKKQGYHQGPVLDMCTGSSVIAVVLSLELEADNVVAVDISTDALIIAKQNICKFGLEEKITLICSDLFTALRENKQYEVIVANPPYISEEDIIGLQPEVEDWEPRSALSGGSDGLDLIERIADQAHRYLVPGGWLFVEIGSDQREKVDELFSCHGSKEYDNVAILSDWSGHPRLCRLEKKGKCNG
jgi:release factor glutamine methyltransferase